MKEEGVIKWISEAKGFGFITREHGLDVYLRWSTLVAEGVKTIAIGDRISFTIIEGSKGLEARNVQKIS